MSLPQSSTNASAPTPKNNVTRTKDKQDRLPAPLDPFGNEVCLLFLKYGKCRYGKKCKLSHIKPDPDAPPPTRMVPVTNEEPQPSIAPDVKFSLSKKRLQVRDQVSSPSTAVVQRTTNPGAMHSPAVLTSNEESIEITDKSTGSEESGQLESLKTPAASSGRDEAQHTTTLASSRKRRKVVKESSESAPLLAPYFVKPNRPSASFPTPSQSRVGVARPTTGNREGSSATKQSSNTKISKSGGNAATIPGDRIEKWYATYRAELDPKTGRLMMTAGSPDTRGKKLHLKAMRRHHWECKQAVLQALERTVPKTYSLKIARSRIDWPRVTPYLALALQAAFELDITHEYLPVLALTVRAQLEHNALSGRALEALLVSWGISELQARRCGNLIWEMMVSAAGDASIAEDRLGVGYIVRQVQAKHDFIILRDRLSMYSEQQ